MAAWDAPTAGPPPDGQTPTSTSGSRFGRPAVVGGIGGLVVVLIAVAVVLALRGGDGAPPETAVSGPGDSEGSGGTREPAETAREPGGTDESLVGNGTLASGFDTDLQLVSGYLYSCVLRYSEEELVCWGLDPSRHQAAPDLAFETISAGRAHLCGLREDGSVVCWGDDAVGQASPPAGLRAQMISAGNQHSCALDLDGQVVCWGSDSSGQIGVNSHLVVLTTLSAGSNVSCGLLPDDGGAYCWGRGVGRFAPQPPGLQLRTIATGFSHACALNADGAPLCFGPDDDGETSPPPGLRLTAITAGGGFTCALDEEGAAVCWGVDSEGQSSPPGDLRFTVIDAGLNHTCGLTIDGEVACWGDGMVGQTDPPASVAVGGGADPTTSG